MSDESKKGGGSGGGMGKGTIVAIMTALITAGTTIVVTMINKDDPAPAPAPAPTPGPVDPGKTGGAGTGTSAEPSSPLPAANIPQIANVAGNWISADGERMQIVQTGTQFTVSAVGMSEVGPISAQGVGQVSGSNVTWTLQSNLAGNIVEMGCSARLTSAGNSLQGSCDAMGQRFPFIYNR
ncbi:MAG: hypothetical protein V3V15_06090 [Sphingorhabdus sp.]